MPIGDPNALGIAAVGSLSVHLDAGDRLASLQNCPNDEFDPIGKRRNCLSNGPIDVVGDRNAANLSQPLINLDVAAIATQEREADRSRIVDKFKFGRTHRSLRIIHAVILVYNQVPQS